MAGFIVFRRPAATSGAMQRPRGSAPRGEQRRVGAASPTGCAYSPLDAPNLLGSTANSRRRPWDHGPRIGVLQTLARPAHSKPGGDYSEGRDSADKNDVWYRRAVYTGVLSPIQYIGPACMRTAGVHRAVPRAILVRLAPLILVTAPRWSGDGWCGSRITSTLASSSSSVVRLPLFSQSTCGLRSSTVGAQASVRQSAAARSLFGQVRAHPTVSTHKVHGWREGNRGRQRSPHGSLWGPTVGTAVSIWWAREGSNLRPHGCEPTFSSVALSVAVPHVSVGMS